MFQNLCHEWQNPWFMWNGHSSKYCDLVSEIPKRFHYLKVFQRSCYSERETSIPGWLAQIVSGLKTSCLQQSLWPPCWTDLAAPWLRVGSAYFPGSCFYLQKQEASTVPSDRKIGYKTQSQKRKKKKPVSHTGALPVMQRTLPRTVLNPQILLCAITTPSSSSSWDELWAHAVMH